MNTRTSIANRRIRACTAIGFALPIFAAGAANAAVLTTPPASASYAGETLLCSFLNSGPTIESMTIEVRAFDGSLVYSISNFSAKTGENVTVEPAANNGAYCRFLFPGSPKFGRAQAVYTDTSTGRPSITIPAR